MEKFSGKKEVRVRKAYGTLKELKDDIQENVVPFLGVQEFYVQHNGKILSTDEAVVNLLGMAPEEEAIEISVFPRLVGGKGGFGSMLRAIGAQIEKTTNRDACRDLSGRRLRDINEEQRMRKWYEKQAEREKERQEARKRKLEMLRKVADGPDAPKITDQDFMQKSEEITEAVYDAVEEAFRDGNKIDALNAAGSDDSSDGSSKADQKKPEQGPSSSATSGNDPEPVASSATSSTKAEKPEKANMRKTMFDEDLSTDSSDDETSTEICKA